MGNEVLLSHTKRVAQAEPPSLGYTLKSLRFNKSQKILVYCCCFCCWHTMGEARIGD